MKTRIKGENVNQAKVLSPQNAIVKQLVESGVIPARCTRFEFICDSKEVVRIRTECWATQEEVQAIKDALEANPEAAKHIARSMLIRSAENPEIAVAVDLPEGIA